MSKNLFNNKTAKGLVSFVTIIVLLSSILATSFFYENSITANVIREDSANWESSSAAITEVNDIHDLNQLNEGWYEVRNGFVFYLDTFNSYVPLYIRIANIEYQDGLMVVDGDGNVEFSYRINGLNEKVVADEENKNIETNSNKITAAAIRDITGDVTGGQTVTKANIFLRWWCSCNYYLGNTPLKEKDKFWDSQGNEYTVGLFSLTMLEKNSKQWLPVDDVSKLPPNDFYVSNPVPKETASLQEATKGDDGGQAGLTDEDSLPNAFQRDNQIYVRVDSDTWLNPETKEAYTKGQVISLGSSLQEVEVPQQYASLIRPGEFGTVLGAGPAAAGERIAASSSARQEASQRIAALNSEINRLSLTISSRCTGVRPSSDCNSLRAQVGYKTSEKIRLEGAAQENPVGTALDIDAKTVRNQAEYEAVIKEAAKKMGKVKIDGTTYYIDEDSLKLKKDTPWYYFGFGSDVDADEVQGIISAIQKETGISPTVTPAITAPAPAAPPAQTLEDKIFSAEYDTAPGQPVELLQEGTDFRLVRIGQEYYLGFVDTGDVVKVEERIIKNEKIYADPVSGAEFKLKGGVSGEQIQLEIVKLPKGIPSGTEKPTEVSASTDTSTSQVKPSVTAKCSGGYVGTKCFDLPPQKDEEVAAPSETTMPLPIYKNEDYYNLPKGLSLYESEIAKTKFYVKGGKVYNLKGTEIEGYEFDAQRRVMNFKDFTGSPREINVKEKIMVPSHQFTLSEDTVVLRREFTPDGIEVIVTNKGDKIVIDHITKKTYVYNVADANPTWRTYHEQTKEGVDQNLADSVGTKAIQRSEEIELELRANGLITSKLPPPKPQVPTPTIEEWKKQVDKEAQWDEEKLKQNIGDFYVDKEGYIWTGDLAGAFIIGKADQDLFQKYEEKNVQVDLQGTIRLPSTILVSAPTTQLQSGTVLSTGRGEDITVNEDGTATGADTKSTYVLKGSEWVVKASDNVPVPKTGEILPYESPLLKQALWSLGFADYDIKTKSVTIYEEGVIAFQEKHGLTQDGFVGPITAAKMNEVLESERKAQKPAQIIQAAPAPAAPPPAQQIKLPEGTEKVDYSNNVVGNKRIDEFIPLSSKDNTINKEYNIIKTGNELYLVTNNDPNVGYEAKALKISSTEVMLYSQKYPEQFVIVPLADVPKGIVITETVTPVAIPPAQAPPAPASAASPPTISTFTLQQIGTLDNKYANPATNKVPQFVRLDNFEVVGEKVCEKIQCAEITPGKQWVPGVGIVDIASSQSIPGALAGSPAGQQRIEAAKRTVLNNQLVELYDKDKQTNLQKIVIGRTYKPDGTVDKEGKEILVSPSIIAGLDLKSLANVDLTRDIFSFRTPQKSTDVLITSDAQTRTDAEIGKDGKLTREIKTEFFTSGDRKGETKTTTRDKLTEKPQKTEELKFADGSTRTTNFDGDTDTLTKVTYKSKEGKTLELNGQDWLGIKNNLGDNADTFLKLAVAEGFQKAKLDSNGNLVEGNKKITAASDGQTVSVLEGDRVVKSTKVTKEGIQTTEYSGNVRLDINGQPDVITIDNANNLPVGATFTSTTYIEKGGERQLLQFVQIEPNRRVQANYENQNYIAVTSQIRTKDGGYDRLNIEIESTTRFGLDRKYKIINGFGCTSSNPCDLEFSSGPFGATLQYIGIGGVKVTQDGRELTLLSDLEKQHLQTGIKSAIDAKHESLKQPKVEEFNSQRFFADVERVLTDFQGLGYYSTLFFDEDSLLAWRDNVDRVFATLYLGTEYWSSSICGSYLDGEGEGIAYAETPQGLAQVGAHIEATRSEPLITPTGVEFLYKITFNVRNGDYDEDPRAPEQMNINVFLRGEKTATVFRQDQTVKRGSSFGKIGRNAIVKYSTTLYTEVCLTFDQIPLRWKLDNGELCNTIVAAGGAATPVASSGASAPASSGTGTGEFNDF